jgi:Fe-S oxidoreductase
VLGRIGATLRAASRFPRLANRLAGSAVGRVAHRVAGLAPERPAPALAAVPFSRWWRSRGGSRVDGPPVLLFVDTFTETLHPEVGIAAVRVLEAAGHHVHVPPRAVCCGRPRYDHGMLDEALDDLRDVVHELGPAALAGVPIVGLEPSCVAALRDELPSLRTDATAAAIAGVTRTLAEHLLTVGLDPPPIAPARRVLLHGHCQQRAVVGLRADVDLLRRTGAEVVDLDAGCCGLAGSFGYRAGDPYEVSVAAAERKLLPAVRDTGPDDLVVADGSSCRTQVMHLLGDRVGPAGHGRPLHLAELLATLVAGERAP